MTLYAATLALHVIVAIVGIGLIGAIPVAAHVARRTTELPGALLSTLFRISRVSLGVMAVTGILLDFVARGLFHSTVWFRASGALFVVAAFFLTRASSALRKGGAEGGATTLARVERWSWLSCATVALMAVMMAVKPFQ